MSNFEFGGHVDLELFPRQYRFPISLPRGARTYARSLRTLQNFVVYHCLLVTHVRQPSVELKNKSSKFQIYSRMNLE